MSPISPATFKDQVYAAARAAFSAVIKNHPNQGFYTFGFFTDDSLQFLHPVANTEEALTATVKRYNETVDLKYGCTSTRAGMRWSYGDWGFFPDVGGNHFDGINRTLIASFDSRRRKEPAVPVASLWDAVLTGFQRLEQESFFGEGATRAKITLLVVGDLPSEFVADCVGYLNPAEVVDRYLNWDCDAPEG